MDFDPFVGKVGKKKEKEKKDSPPGERKVKCPTCTREFHIPAEKDEAFCVHCGKKNAYKPSSPAPAQPVQQKPQHGRKHDKKIISLDALLHKPAAKPPEAAPAQAGAATAPASDETVEPAGDAAGEEYIEQCQCPVCNTIVAADAPKCPACGVAFAEGDAADGAKEEANKGQKPLNVCDSCGKLQPDVDRLATCAKCGKTFCESCPGPKIPPEPKSLEAKVVYKYKLKKPADLKQQTLWTSDATKFNELLPSPLCRSCYMSEYDKALLRLRSKVKTWEIDIRRDADAKILEEVFPERKEVVKKKNVIPAQDFLKWVAKS